MIVAKKAGDARGLANPVVSKWSFLQVSNPIRRIRAIEARGGKVVVVEALEGRSTRSIIERIRDEGCDRT